MNNGTSFRSVSKWLMINHNVCYLSQATSSRTACHCDCCIQAAAINRSKEKARLTIYTSTRLLTSSSLACWLCFTVRMKNWYWIYWPSLSTAIALVHTMNKFTLKPIVGFPTRVYLQFSALELDNLFTLTQHVPKNKYKNKYSAQQLLNVLYITVSIFVMQVISQTRENQTKTTHTQNVS